MDFAELTWWMGAVAEYQRAISERAGGDGG